MVDITSWTTLSAPTSCGYLRGTFKLLRILWKFSAECVKVLWGNGEVASFSLTDPRTGSSVTVNVTGRHTDLKGVTVDREYPQSPSRQVTAK